MDMPSLPEQPLTGPDSRPMPGTSAPKSGRALFIVVLLIVALAVACASYAYFSGIWLFATPAETEVPGASPSPASAGWNTYTNAQYGFSFRYPADRTLHEETHTGDTEYSGGMPAGFSVGLETDFGVHEPGYQSLIPDYQRFELDITDISPIASIGERACQPAFEGTSCITGYRTIGGVLFVTTAFEVTDGVAAGDKEKEAATIQDGKLFHFYTGFRGVPQEYGVAELARTETMFDRILSTFRFANQ